MAEDAVRSLGEGLVETLTLHRLGGVAEALGGSLGTTNCLEPILIPGRAQGPPGLPLDQQ